MSDFYDDSINDLQAALKNAQLAADKVIRENDKAIEWASNEISFYRKTLAYVFECLKGKSIYWASPKWTKIEKHTVEDVKIEVQDTGFFGEEFKDERVVKVFVDDGKSYFIGEKLGENLFLTEKAAKEVAKSK